MTIPFPAIGRSAHFDIHLKWVVDAPVGMVGPGVSDAPSAALPDAAGPSIFIALQEQLGLKLESGKGPVEVLVMDRMERPSAN